MKNIEAEDLDPKISRLMIFWLIVTASLYYPHIAILDVFRFNIITEKNMKSTHTLQLTFQIIDEKNIKNVLKVHTNLVSFNYYFYSLITNIISEHISFQ
jgi:hypothetical protein